MIVVAATYISGLSQGGAKGDASEPPREPILEFGADRVAALARGRIGLIAAGLPQMALVPWVALTSGQRLLVGPADESPVDAQELLDWLADGSWTPVIDSHFVLAEGSAAHARVSSGRKRGSVLLSVASDAAGLGENEAVAV